MLKGYDKWFLAFLAFSLCAGFLGYCGREANGVDKRTFNKWFSKEKRQSLNGFSYKYYRFPYENYASSLPSHYWGTYDYPFNTVPYGWTYGQRVIRWRSRPYCPVPKRPLHKHHRNYFRHRR